MIFILHIKKSLFQKTRLNLYPYTYLQVYMRLNNNNKYKNLMNNFSLFALIKIHLKYTLDLIKIILNC